MSRISSMHSAYLESGGGPDCLDSRSADLEQVALTVVSLRSSQQRISFEHETVVQLPCSSSTVRRPLASAKLPRHRGRLNGKRRQSSSGSDGETVASDEWAGFREISRDIWLDCRSRKGLLLHSEAINLPDRALARLQSLARRNESVLAGLELG